MIIQYRYLAAAVGAYILRSCTSRRWFRAEVPDDMQA
jgi:hypothetical protein